MFHVCVETVDGESSVKFSKAFSVTMEGEPIEDYILFDQDDGPAGMKESFLEHLESLANGIETSTTFKSYDEVCNGGLSLIWRPPMMEVTFSVCGNMANIWAEVKTSHDIKRVVSELRETAKAINVLSS